LAALCAAPALAVAFTSHALTTSAAPLGDRIDAGRGLLAVLVACLLAVLAAGALALRAERRLAWREVWTRRVWAGLGAAALLGVGRAAARPRRRLVPRPAPPVPPRHAPGPPAARRAARVPGRDGPGRRRPRRRRGPRPAVGRNCCSARAATGHAGARARRGAAG